MLHLCLSMEPRECLRAEVSGLDGAKSQSSESLADVKQRSECSGYLGPACPVLRQLRTWQRFQAEPEKLCISHHTCPHLPLGTGDPAGRGMEESLSPWSHPVVSASGQLGPTAGPA